jgi:acetyl-CoA carboxylase biotin carboxyl carrier protein
MTIKEIREILELFTSSDVAEMEVQRGENRVVLKRAPAVSHVVVAPAAATGAPAPVAAPVAGAAPAAAPPSPAEEATEVIKSPIVGTYYDAPSPGAPPFVKVGDTVEAGQVLCIIESMKLMNEIEAEKPGVIVAKLVENGRPVEFGQPLFSIQPR